MSSSGGLSLFPSSAVPDSDTSELVLNSSTSSRVSSTLDPNRTSPPEHRALLHNTSSPAVSRSTYHPHGDHPVKDRNHDKQHYIRFDQDKDPSQRLPKTQVQRAQKTELPARMVTSFEDISSLRLWKGIVAEFLGTLLLTLVGCGSCINLRGDSNTTSPIVQLSLCFGLTVATIVWSIGHISGGHINPAVTVAMLAARKISLAKAVFFILFQLIGAVVGAAILLGLTPSDYHGGLGVTSVNKNLNLGQAVAVEFFATFVLVFAVFASCDGKRKDLNGSTPLAIGLAVTTCHLWAIDYTGSSMNTARSFGPALVMGRWEDHWVYWLGPLFGGAVAGLLYEHLFAVNASLLKAKACLLSSDYDDDKYKARKLKVRILEEDSRSEEDNGEEMDELGKTGTLESYNSKV